MVVLGAYILGSGICGGAKNEAMLIGGRTIQGVGSGGLVMAAEVIIADLVPLRHRGNYVSMLLVVSTVGNAIGPFVGGVIVENTTWRWVSWLRMKALKLLKLINFLGLLPKSSNWRNCHGLLLLVPQPPLRPRASHP